MSRTRQVDWCALAPPGHEALVERAVALAACPWVHASRVRRVVAARLEMAATCSIEQVLAGLEGHPVERHPPATAAAVQQAAARLRAAGARVLLAGLPGYPAHLTDAWPELGAPPWLFVRAPAGSLPPGPAVAVVGTRQPSLDGLGTAGDLARMLANAGVTVVSGMARGIDQAAHRGALDAGGATVAVLGAGFGVDYPKGDGGLRREIAESGGLATELLPGTPPKAPHFLARNRILSALADVTVVVEGRVRSGALHTARLAAGQGREVFAVPGSLNALTSRAPLDLLRDGARPLTRLEDVFEVLDALPPRGEWDGAGHAVVGGRMQALLDLLGATPAPVAELATALAQPVPTLLADLAELTERGLAVSTPRGVIRR